MFEKNWNLDKVLDQLQMRAIQRRRPLNCTLELTYRCNFHCKMCYIRMADAQAAAFGRMRTAEEWLDMARQLRDAGVLNLTLTGGECTRYPEFERLYEQLAQMGFRITVMSNAGAYTDSLRALFSRYPPNGVAVTLYGGSNETYEAVTGTRGSLDEVVRNIRFLRSAGIPVKLNFTMIRQNAMDYPKVDQLCRELGMTFTLITDITRHHQGETFSDALECRLSPAERACVACHPPDEVAIAMENARELEKELTYFRMPEAPAEPLPPEMDACIGSSTACTIYWNGDMATCISMRGYRNVKPFETGFEAAWKQLKADQDTTFLRSAVCQACSMAHECLHRCPARRFEGTGSPLKPDPYTCQYTFLLQRYKARQNHTECPPVPPCL